MLQEEAREYRSPMRKRHTARRAYNKHPQS
jgi:hypothetical protein